jgi:hypothetical protein
MTDPIRLLDQLDDRIGLFVDRTAQEFGVVHDHIGPLPTLTTAAKTRLVDALNELDADLAALDLAIGNDLTVVDGGNF